MIALGQTGADAPKGDPATEPAAGEPPAKLAKGTAKPKAPSAQDVLMNANKFLDAAKCKACGGDGEVTVERVVGSREVAPRGRINTRPTSTYYKRPKEFGPRVTQVETADFVETCDNCSGQCIAKMAVFSLPMDKLVTSLAKVNTTDAKWEKLRDDVLNRLQKAASLGLSNWSARLDDSVRTKLGAGDSLIGKPIVCVGTLVSDDKGADHRTMKVRIDTHLFLTINDPRLVDAIGGETVLVGGVMVQNAQKQGPDTFAVAEKGFVVKPRAVK